MNRHKIGSRWFIFGRTEVEIISNDNKEIIDNELFKNKKKTKKISCKIIGTNSKKYETGKYYLIPAKMLYPRGDRQKN